MLGAGFMTHLHLLPMAGDEDVTADGPLARWLANAIPTCRRRPRLPLIKPSGGLPIENPDVADL